ncbi:ABC transporter, permease protein, putative [Methylophaga frappieri]|uniref:ABC transporter, permease protein, putative n=1 Tax=Methylophaga frappieri (strain ATCC BAA-2434 / DSM 25690 / JAM7) TaxID=754477 RepID=I1YHE9_METFJ|nr:ABC transporter permease subunit [Methylophaga frappieri]AFJ02342.1 ABC transporter, permease protein, putative [Methylophaga frappieri]
MWLIAKMEFYRLFITPVAWVVMAIVQLLLAYLFLSQVEYFSQIQGQMAAIPGAPGVTEMVVAPFLSNLAVVLLLVSPFITMRSFAEERRHATLPLLITAPLSGWQIVLGKFLGHYAFFALLTGVTILMPLALLLGSPIDLGQLAAGVMGLFLYFGLIVAIGIVMSSVSAQPALAAIGTFGVLFLLWIIDWVGTTSQGDVTLFSWLAILGHLEPMLAGEIRTADIAYYVILTVSLLLITIRRLDALRRSK